MAIDQATLARPTAPSPVLAKALDSVGYWLGLPVRWARQMVRNGSDILRVLDIIRFRPLPAGLVDLDHPWVTGINPQTDKPIWHDNVIYRSPRPASDTALAEDDVILLSNGRFLANRVRQSAVTPELPVGPQRRMPHAINYMHGASHYNSGIIILNDLQDGYRHITDPQFRRELYRFVRTERREVLFLFRERTYDPREYAYFSCCMRSLFPWFCNPNGPQERVLWGNAAPFPAANLITGCWADDVYALKRPGGAAKVVRPPIRPGGYLTNGPFNAGRSAALWPEKALAWLTYLRVKIRGAKGGMFFIDRRKIYEDQIRNRESRGISDEPQARFLRN